MNPVSLISKLRYFVGDVRDLPRLELAMMDVDFVIHIGARTDTTEFNMDVLNALNLDYTKQMWVRCSDYEVPLIYASSAATYGMGEYGYMDNHHSNDCTNIPSHANIQLNFSKSQHSLANRKTIK